MARRHHYVPQFYLRRFAIKDRPKIIWVYKRGEEPKDINITNVAVRDSYYTVTVEATKEKSDQFETMFTKIENDAAPIFRRLVSEGGGATYLSKDELLALTNFVAFQYLRGPGFREKLLQGEVHKLTERIDEITKDKETFREATKKMYSDPEDKLEERRQGLIEASEYVKEGKVYFKRERGEEGLTLSVMMDFVQDIHPLIFHRRWIVLKSELEGVFITSDNPVFIMATVNNQQTEIEAFKTGIIVLPISPSRCLILEPGRVSHTIPVLRPTPERVKRINEGVRESAYESVFAHYESKRIKRGFDTTKAREYFKLIGMRSEGESKKD